jgi:hypothetical protein
VCNLDESRAPMLALMQQFTGGAVAQLGARLDGIEEVVGSNPIGSTNFSHCLSTFTFFRANH